MSLVKLIKIISRPAPSGFKNGMSRKLGNALLTKKALNWYIHNPQNFSIDDSVEAFLISFPKCGRTWLTMMIGKALSLHYGIEDINPLSLPKLSRACSGVPRLKATHDDKPQWKAVNQLITDKSHYKDKEVIFLVRDVRDVAVSLYFQKTRRVHQHGRARLNDKDMSAFIRAEVGSVDSLIAFYRIWYENRHVPKGFLLVRYEDLHADAARELRRVLEFLNVNNVSDDVINESIAYASFDNMRRIEAKNELSDVKLRPGDINDPESYKTRKGKIGGYTEYLTQHDIDLINEKIKASLPGFY